MNSIRYSLGVARFNTMPLSLGHSAQIHASTAVIVAAAKIMPQYGVLHKRWENVQKFQPTWRL